MFGRVNRPESSMGPKMIALKGSSLDPEPDLLLSRHSHVCYLKLFPAVRGWEAGATFAA